MKERGRDVKKGVRKEREELEFFEGEEKGKGGTKRRQGIWEATRLLQML